MMNICTREQKKHSLRMIGLFCALLWVLSAAACRQETDEELLVEDEIFESFEDTSEPAETPEQVTLQPETETAESAKTAEAENSEELIRPIEGESGSRDYDLTANASDAYSRVFLSNTAIYYADGVVKNNEYLSFINRADLSSGESRIYCAKPGCSHDSAECDACIEGTPLQIYGDSLIFQTSTGGSGLLLQAIPLGYRGSRETFLEIPLKETLDRLDMDAETIWPQTVLHRDTAVVYMTAQGEFTGSGYEREGAEEDETEAPLNDFWADTKEQSESRYDYKAAVCVYPFGEGRNGEVKPLIVRDIPDVGRVWIEVLPYGDDIYILLESILSEAYFEIDSSGNGGGGTVSHLGALEIYRFRIGAEEAELLYNGPAPFDGLCGTTVDSNAIRFLALRDAIEEEADGFCDYLLTGFDLSERRFYDPVPLLKEDEYASRPRFGDGYVSAVTFSDPSLVFRGMITDISRKEFGATKIHIYNYNGKEEQYFDFDQFVPDSVGKTMEFHYVPNMAAGWADEMMIVCQDHSLYSAQTMRALMSLTDGELRVLHKKE